VRRGSGSRGGGGNRGGGGATQQRAQCNAPHANTAYKERLISLKIEIQSGVDIYNTESHTHVHTTIGEQK